MSITKKDIETIITKYNIGKRPLSIILGLGEITITRYLNGESNPNEQISKLLLNILNDSSLYLEYLENNKGKISPIAYGKSKTVVLKLLNVSTKEDKKLQNVAEYIVENNKDTTNLSLQKLLYYCQLFSYVLYDKPMFSSSCDAWDHGPVFDQVYYKYKKFGNNPIEEDINIALDGDTKNLVDKVIDNFGYFSGPTLCYFTHSEDPWKDAYVQNKKISNEAIKSFAGIIRTEYSDNNNIISDYADKLLATFKRNKGGR